MMKNISSQQQRIRELKGEKLNQAFLKEIL